MKSEKLQDALGQINDEYIADAHAAVVKRPSKIRRAIIIAACAVFVLCCTATFWFIGKITAGSNSASLDGISADEYKLYTDDKNEADDTNTTAELPSDFSFSIVWGCYGISSYDSKTGELIKTKDTSDVAKYTDYVKMSESQLKLIYKYLCTDIDLADYPTDYNPFGNLMSDPTQTIIITVTANGKTNTVSCRNIALGSLSDCIGGKAKAFIKAKNNVVSLITSLPEWQAFPDYEIFYD